MNLETKITIYKFTPQLFTLTPKELLHAGKCSLEELPQRCGFASRSAFYASFSKIVGMSPLRFLAREQNNSLLESMIYV